jgi:hypothetical protein
MLHHGLVILLAWRELWPPLKRASRNCTICPEPSQLSATACVAVG